MSTIGFHLADRYEPRAYGNGSHPHKQPGVLRASCPFAHTSQTCADEGTGGGTLTTIWPSFWALGPWGQNIHIGHAHDLRTPTAARAQPPTYCQGASDAAVKRSRALGRVLESQGWSLLESRRYSPIKFPHLDPCGALRPSGVGRLDHFPGVLSFFLLNSWLIPLTTWSLDWILSSGKMRTENKRETSNMSHWLRLELKKW